MITHAYSYLALLIILAVTIAYIAKKSHHKLFDYLPSIVILYFVVMLLSTLGVWQKSMEITMVYKILKNNLLPAMIFLMLLSADIREIFKLGKKILLTFLLASASIALGFIGMYTLFHYSFKPDAWRSFAALAGSWMGGTGNMIAIQGALDVPDTDMGYALLIDSIDYAIWVMILLALVPFAKRFNHWTGADTYLIDKVGEKLMQKEQARNKVNVSSVLLLLFIGTMVSLLSQYIGNLLPTTDFLTHTTWIVIIATIMGVIGAMTLIGKIGGASEIGMVILYLIVALIASRANFKELIEAPLYIFSGFVIIAIHVVVMVLFAKLFKLDLFSLGVASLANIGGVASAPILASTYSKALIPIGVLMAMMGYILGTFGGLMVGKVLELIASF
ncbi:MAG: DUF819 family protein [Sulfurovum sp.]|nr:DUF819 family protein [Sulfurovum sp.]MCB4753855.1 DUF819 family protein [Sulfurovum sp.]MCB4761914.1 DUF819 family protein [Sulfurovum sp.]MCB4772724.1 DUF819 family protein [Sulfurovum sp.]MCB4775714.1 DUF819 family protein [Sulfurovum sp.]